MRNSRTANACGGSAALVTLEASSPPLATASSGSARSRGRDARPLSSEQPGPRASVSRGRASLTLQEREVALLAATGMTNREIAAKLFVSPRTVSAHLYRIFPKLGITSRAALRDALNVVSGDAGH